VVRNSIESEAGTGTSLWNQSGDDSKGVVEYVVLRTDTLGAGSMSTSGDGNAGRNKRKVESTDCLGQKEISVCAVKGILWNLT